MAQDIVIYSYCLRCGTCGYQADMERYTYLSRSGSFKPQEGRHEKKERNPQLTFLTPPIITQQPQLKAA